MTIWNSSTNTAQYLDARETASRHANSSMFGGNPNLSYQGSFKKHCVLAPNVPRNLNYP